MATLNADSSGTVKRFPTLMDVAMRMDPDGSPPIIAELLAMDNAIIADMPMFEGNLPTGHRGTIRTGLPVPIWRKLYGGVPSQKSTTMQVDDTCGMLESRSEVDKDLCELNGNTNAFRMSEATAFLEAMGQAAASTLFYGNTDVNPERFMGLSPRFALTTAGNGDNVLLAGGSSGGTDSSSVWLIRWGQNRVHGIYPKNSIGGLVHEDLGLGDSFDASGNPYRAYRERFQWKIGLHVKDWRNIVRIANVDTSDLNAVSGTQETTDATNLITLMLRALERLPGGNTEGAVFYMNKTVRQGLRIQAIRQQANVLSISQGRASFATDFCGVPIHLCDSILNTEAVAS